MLPSYAELDPELDSLVRAYLERRIREFLGEIGTIPRMRYHEGAYSSVRNKGKEPRTGSFGEISGAVSIPKKEARSLTLADVLSKYDAIAEQMAGQMARGVYQTVGEAAEAVGNVVKARPLDGPTVLDLLDKIQIEFTSEGAPILPTLHVGEQMAEAAKRAFEELDAKPELQERWRTLIEKKLDEWNTREASRVLVG